MNPIHDINDIHRSDARLPRPEDNSFSTPDNYFDQLGDRIRGRIKSGLNTVPREIPVRSIRNRKVLIAVAALFLVLVTVPTVWKVLYNRAANEQTTAEEQSDQEHYYLLSLASYSEEEFVDMLLEAVGHEEDILLYPVADASNHAAQGQEDELSDKDIIIEYLLDDGIGESELYDL